MGASGDPMWENERCYKIELSSIQQRCASEGAVQLPEPLERRETILQGFLKTATAKDFSPLLSSTPFLLCCPSRSFLPFTFVLP